jgi:predicted MFS family arabinose efflux permease
MEMMVQTPSADADVIVRPAAWGAVLALSLAVFALVASEFMPVSLLTPIATDLQVTEGQAGQAISISGFFAILASLFASSVAGKLDRKILLLVMTALMVVSGTVVSLAPNYLVFMVGRALIGVAIGGFWSMSAAVAMRLVPDEDVPRALAILNGGNALAMVIAAPLGSFLGDLVGWRAAFFCTIPLAMLALVWQLLSVPAMRAEAQPGAGAVFKLLGRPVVALGMAAVSLFFMGQFSLFTYLRPFLETVTQVDVSVLSLLLLMMGITGFIGTSLIGGVLNTGLYRILVILPVAMAGIAATLIMLGGTFAAVVVLLAFWGLFATSAPVAWWTWLARTLPRDAEAGGGLVVAVVQLAITLGATLGGLLYDSAGYRATFGMSVVLLVLAALMTVRTAALARR